MRFAGAYQAPVGSIRHSDHARLACRAGWALQQVLGAADLASSAAQELSPFLAWITRSVSVPSSAIRHRFRPMLHTVWGRASVGTSILDPWKGAGEAIGPPALRRGPL